MECVNADDVEWRSVMVGPELLGWAGPHAHSDRFSASRADITVLMGDGRFKINVVDFTLQLLGIQAVEDVLDKEESNLVREAITYYRHFRVPFPVGSLDISDAGEIEYSTRTVETLCIGLAKFFKAMEAMVQSELHISATPIEVVRICAELVAYRYPKVLMNQMTWRGVKLNSLLSGSRIRVKASTQNLDASSFGFQPSRYSGFGPPGLLQGVTPFGAFVEWQTRTHYSSSCRAPENTFLVRASSTEEEKQGQRLLLHPHLLKRFAKATGRAMMSDASFFLCPAGDPLEGWIDGEVFSVEELAELISS